jgi:transcriptional regulator with XRE-family HTH domain
LSAAEVNQFLGARLRELRRKARMSQAFLAGGMTDRGYRWYGTTVHRIETGRQAATFEEVRVLAEIFAVPLDSFSPPEEAAS